MQQWLDKLTDLTAIEANQGNLEQALAGLTEQIGFGGYACLSVRPGHTFAISNYHPDWQSLYFERNYLALDPVVKRGRSLKRIFTWPGEQDMPRVTKAERSFYSHAANFGIRSGISVSVRTANGAMSMFTMASDRPTIDLDQEIDAVGRITAQVSQNVYDSATGHRLLIPQGTKLFGRYDSKVSFGQNVFLSCGPTSSSRTVRLCRSAACRGRMRRDIAVSMTR